MSQVKLIEKYDTEFCNTCQCKIREDTSRILHIINKSGDSLTLHYHYFFPCWDLSLFCQRYPDFRISSAGYMCHPEILQNPKMVRNMKKNLDLW